MSDRWSFWLDVGGTFTDCLALRPDGVLLRRKVLSSARTKGRLAFDSSAAILLDPARQEPDNFWAGYVLRVLNAQGQLVDASPILHSSPTTGALELAEPLQTSVQLGGHSYEIISPEPAPILAIRLFLGLKYHESIPPCDVKLGTTKGTNALLTRTGAATAFITTKGFGDLLRIGYQNRPKLFALNIQKQVPLHEVSVEVEERVAADGTVLHALNAEQARSKLQQLRELGIGSLAICLLHAWKNSAHELQLEQLAREAGFADISVSHRVSPGMKIVPRGDTTLVDAYLSPVLRDYVRQLQSLLPGSDLRLLTSAGSLVRAENFTGKDSVLSGPAGGVTGFARAAEAAGFRRAIGFDMGGTSTDVARYAGQFETEYETQKAGVRLVTPMLAVETVAAGGGSICRWDGVKLIVGPESAGADPGPACYGRGGPLTVTDCNFYLGRIVPAHFPFPLDLAAVETRLGEVAAALSSSSAPARTSAELASGFIEIANAHMAAAIRSVSIARGYDVRDNLLVAFGAAAAQHACAVARQLGMKQILSHPDAGVLSALGIGLADVIKHEVAPLYCEWPQLPADELKEIFLRLHDQARAALLAEGVAPEQMTFTRQLDLRYAGTDVPLTVNEPADLDWPQAFAAEHQRRYGYVQPGRELAIACARVTGVGHSNSRLPVSVPVNWYLPTFSQTQLLHESGSSELVPLFDRTSLRPGARIDGPAIIVEPLTTTIVDPAWQATMLSDGELLLNDVLSNGDLRTEDTREGEAPAEPPRLARGHGSAGASHSRLQASQLQQEADPVLLEIFNQQFTAIATQMGHTLRNTSVSVNVKERLDFSCAIFTPAGDLVVNAPHIPVHLGAMSETVRSVLRDCSPLAPGDVVVTNDPYRGGSHLPDVTVVTPVFNAASELLFFTASRAHHAEIGGITPGSMPPFSKSLSEEGVLIRNFKVLQAGHECFGELAQLLLSGPFPTRAVAHNLADIRAQLAANQQGATELLKLVERYSLPVVRAYMQHISTAAETKTRHAIARLSLGTRRFVDYLDDGTRIEVTITARSAEEFPAKPLLIDFTGTAGVHPGNLNANRAIVTAAVLYSLRLLVAEDIPLNEGVLAPVELVIPPGLLNPPASERAEDCPAIVGGNVETSQRVVDVLLAALDLAAASQGTMNNLLFGDKTFGYYETICGGSGATASASGANAVHTHMTNTRITDPEVLEHRFPVRLHRFAIRTSSGGAGAQHGGDGIVRELEFLQPMTVSLLTQRRGDYRPFGLHGGEPGAKGINLLQRAGQLPETLPSGSQLAVQAGDRLTLETPGGGGWGAVQQ
ncbi:Acetophenone carboxylase gamma subunit [Anatilimnocola aggregata]|uniref:Acetophenone carboxylase gamma subunit n=1 Tax=Anatilimnocola aggregata TaxID=2528021 RepID=A0A517Y857_9BACT|nr:hydantoinase B/oxoprolinase family protein [Anatilimnocola aggregata]QDU26427.1 Acetophenone carboxylase gamma subunit [Anatilimnocola aggregata]